MHDPKADEEIEFAGRKDAETVTSRVSEKGN
jgi:hypothetical protein